MSQLRHWRWASLGSVWALGVAHVVHGRLTGRTLGAVELAQAGQFFAEGVVNPALIALLGITLATAIFGRFFCGWGCHLMALQELAAAGMRRVGIQPRPIRSRLWAALPLAVCAAIYAAPWPAAFRAEWTTHDVLAHLPGPLLAAVTFVVCAGAMTWFLGSLGFCRAVCPYGAIFRVGEAVSPLRVRRVGPCDGCGSCAAACPAGIAVHEEIQRFNRVVSSDCVRCLACEPACPSRSLRVRWGTGAGRLGGGRSGFSLGEDLAMGAVVLGALGALRGWASALPLLLSASLAVLAGYSAIVLWRMVRSTSVSVRGAPLKAGGAWTGRGAIFAAVLLVGLVALADAALWQLHWRRGTETLAHLGYPTVRLVLSAEERTAALSAAKEYETCRGLTPSVAHFAVDTRLAWTARVLGDEAGAERWLREALAVKPDDALTWYNLGQLLRRAHRRDDAMAAFAQAERLRPPSSTSPPRSGGEEGRGGITDP